MLPRPPAAHPAPRASAAAQSSAARIVPARRAGQHGRTASPPAAAPRAPAWPPAAAGSAPPSGARAARSVPGGRPPAAAAAGAGPPRCLWLLLLPAPAPAGHPAGQPLLQLAAGRHSGHPTGRQRGAAGPATVAAPKCRPSKPSAAAWKGEKAANLRWRRPRCCPHASGT